MSLRSATITAMGCVSPLGLNAAATIEALRRGTDAVRPVDFFPVETFRAKSAGQVPEGFEELAVSHFGGASAWSRASKFVLAAVAEALKARPGFVPDVVIAATTSGGMDCGQTFYRAPNRMTRSRELRGLVREYVPHQPVLNVMELRGWNAPLRVVSNACASGTNALGMAAGLIRRGVARRVAAIGFDALCELVFAGFDALQASSPGRCRPFDLARDGLALGEGAAVFFLEAEGPALARVAGYGCASDNFHLTKPEPGGAGPRLSMQRALADAGWEADCLDYLNAHGTGTPFNDASEAEAVRAVCPHVAMSSTKAMTGHALGAAGAIEAVYCIHAIREGFLPPNLHLENPEPGLNLVANASRPAVLNRVASNSFGFGGSNATILLERGDG